MNGCLNVSLLAAFGILMYADLQLVCRVNWLRSRARRDRWAEELLILETEMGNVVRFFQTMACEWDRRAKAGIQLGQVTYAYRQRKVWLDMASNATERFRQAKEKNMQ